MDNITLPIAQHDEDTDAVITAQGLPALTGNGPDDLLCGQCGEVLGKGLTTDAIGRTITTSRRLLLKCTCGAHNVVHDAAPAGTTDAGSSSLN